MKIEFGERPDYSIWVSFIGPEGEHSQFDWPGSLLQLSLIALIVNAHKDTVLELKSIRDRCQITGMDFEAQSLANTESAIRAINRLSAPSVA